MKTLTKYLLLFLLVVLFVLMSVASSSSDSQKPITGSSDNSSKSDASEAVASDKDINIEEQILVDQDGIIITAKEYTHDSIWGDGIKLLVENNSETNVTVSCRNLVVNHYMISNLFVCDVAAGKKVNKSLDLSSSSLKEAEISTVAEIEASFHVYDSETWDTIFDTSLISIHTSEYGNVSYSPSDSGKELYNDGQIRIVGKYVDEDSFWGAGILLFIENNTAQTIVVHADDLSVNGFMISSIFSCTVCAGRMAIDDITLFSSDLEENDITSIDEVELSFRITDESYFNTIVDTPPISFTVDNP